MLKYLRRRLLLAVPVLLGILISAFVTLELAPGDPLLSRIEPSRLDNLSTEQLDAMRHDLGLDQPVMVRFGIWLEDLAHGDLGYSIVQSRSVGAELGRRIGPTVLLMMVAVTMGSLIGVSLGIISALKRGSWIDQIVTPLSIAFVALPSFVVGLVLIYLLGARWKLLPVSGMGIPGEPFRITDLLRHLVMPATVLALPIAAPVARYMRASVLEVINAEFVTTAVSKGLPGWVVLRSHILRNSWTPILTVVGLMLPRVLGGAVIVEALFSWPGMGQLAVTAASGRDPALMMGVILVVGFGVTLSNLATDLAYAVLDPRVRLVRRA